MATFEGTLKAMKDMGAHVHKTKSIRGGAVEIYTITVARKKRGKKPNPKYRMCANCDHPKKEHTNVGCLEIMPRTKKTTLRFCKCEKFIQY